MKAVVFNRYGGNEVLEIGNMPAPVPGPDDVMIKVKAASVNPVDWKVRYGHVRIFTGGAFPKILGNECSGEVVETGSQVTKFSKGDAVIAYPGVRRLGAFAEYACSSEQTTFSKPGKSSFEEAACIPIAGLTALQALRIHGKIASGKKVLINGAAGGVGHFAVQIARILGARVTAVCSGANADFAKGLGADHVIDYRTDDFTRGTEQYDIIFDAVAKSSFGRCKGVLGPRGVYVSTLPSLSVILNQYVTGFLTGKKAKSMWVRPDTEDMARLSLQIEAGDIGVFIDRVFSLEEIREALAYSESGRARGKIALKIR